MILGKPHFVNLKRRGLAPLRRRQNRSRQLAATATATLPELTDADRGILGHVAIRGMMRDVDIPADVATRLQAHGLIRFDRLGGYWTR